MRRLGSSPPRSALAKRAADSLQRRYAPASPRPLAGVQRKTAGLGQRRRSRGTAVEGGGDLREAQPVLRLTVCRGDRREARPLGAERRARQGSDCARCERISQRHVEQHLLAVVGVHEHEFRRSLADRSHGTFTLTHHHRALRVRKLHDSFQHDEGRLARTVHGQGPVGSADRRHRRRGPDVDAGAAAARAGPDVAGLEVDLRRAAATSGDLVHREGGVASDTDLGLVGEQDRQVADGVRAQGVAAEQILLQRRNPPVGLAHEA
jgi:hypothetical protein